MKNFSLKKFNILTCIFLSLMLYAGTDFHYLSAQDNEVYASGLIIESQDELDAAETADSLMVRAGGTKLPSRVDLSGKLPPVSTQGSQGSCTAWSTTYYTKTYHEIIKNKWSTDWGDFDPYKDTSGKRARVFSPAWTYNQINGGRDSGSSISTAFKLIVEHGAVPWSVMPYSYKDYTTQPSSSMKQLASSRYRAKRYAYVKPSDPENIKRELANGNPVVGGFSVTSNWKRPSKEVCNGGVQDNYSGTVTGGHAMAIVGYDDNKVSPSGHKGAFKIVNSWGKWWGNNGYFWMSYKCLSMLCKYSYVLYDSEASVTPDNTDEKTVKPTGLVTASKGSWSDRIVVSWNRVDGAVSYIVERSIGSSQQFNRVSVVNTNTYTDRNIQADYRYNYRIVTVAANGKSNPASSPVAEGFALNNKNSLPGKVVNLKGISSGSYVNLSWTKVENSTSYRIIRYAQTSRTWTALGKTSALYYTDRSPQKNLPNYYYVAAVNSAGQGEWSNLYKVVLSATSGPPSTVNGIKASSGTYSDRIVVSWNREPSASYYLLYRWDPSTRKWDRHWKINSTRYTDTDTAIRGGKRFTYTVRAYNSKGSSPKWSSYVGGYTSTTSYSVKLKSGIAPEAPSMMKASINEKTREVILTWKSLSPIAMYKIYRKKDTDEKFKLITTTSRGSSRYVEKFPGQDGEIYMYRVAANLAGADSEASDIVSASIEEFRPVVMTTFIPGEGLKNFRGTWRASHLKPDGKAVNMEITIVDQGSAFTARIKYGNREKEIKGDYAAKSRYLETKDFRFRMLPAFDNDVASVVVPAGIFTRSRIVENFARENQD